MNITDAQKAARFIQSRFSIYYENAELQMPPRFGKREWGFFLWGGKGMVRPVVFNTRQELRAFLVSRAPRHAYFSTAYYRDPRVPMAQKEWLGADLIFDLDADHLPGAEEMEYDEMLGRVKVEFVKLLDVYILGDLGFEEKDVEIVFSGGRGYHVHVRHPKVIGLGTHERREIVDYVTGKGLDEDILLDNQTVKLDRMDWGGKAKLKSSKRLFPETEPGWRGKMTTAMKHLGQSLQRELE
ncbi:MAG: DNA primase small subunit domain-containing protein, partial [Candidatus Thermoplasmatota archaeon]|nr:DNA primase small subunit domain-containing protein [Candidatus Thermoplasmatota archaeon]